MIDPKLNEIPVEGEARTDANRTVASKSDRTRTPRPGLSINDTIAGDTVLSSGARGVDTSGVSAGAGAGAGSSFVTPGTATESPAPNIVPGERSTGTTPRAGVNTTGVAASSSGSTGAAETLSTPPSGFPSSARGTVATTGHHSTPSHHSTSHPPNTLDVAERAYQIWCAKGCPEGTAEEDWHQAERELTSESSGNLSKAAVI